MPLTVIGMIYYKQLLTLHYNCYHRCTEVLRSLKLDREQTKFNLAFENLTLVYVSNRPELQQSCDRGTGNEILIPAPVSL